MNAAGTVDRAAARVARRQRGLITDAQARALGFTPAQIRGRRETGRREALAPGVFLMGSAPRSWGVSVLAACLATGGVASHRTAATLHGLASFGPGPIELSVRREAIGSQRRMAGVVVHRQVGPGPVEAVPVAGIPTTPARRLLIDLGGLLDPDGYRAAVDDLIGRGLLSWEDALETLFVEGRRGLRGVGALRTLLLERHAEVLSERALVDALDRITDGAGLRAFEAPYALVDRRGLVAGAAIAWVERRLAIRLGPIEHESRDLVGQRRHRLDTLGWRLLTIDRRLLIRRPDTIVTCLRWHLDQPGAR